MKDNDQTNVNYYDFIYFKKSKQNVFIEKGREKCAKCKAVATYDFIFLNKINFLIIETIGASININDIPEEVVLNNKNFALCCSQIFHSGHFYAIFKIDNENFVVDDLKMSAILLNSIDENTAFFKYPVVASLYYLNS